MQPLPPELDQIANIETLSIEVTKLELERDGIAYMNAAGLSLDERLALGMRVAVNKAKLMKAQRALDEAQDRYAGMPWTK
jgi:hypothetical protein